jgi:dethiobiotin synthetase
MKARAARGATRGFFVTGTDTGVGKTVICCALLHAFAALGKSVVGMKPVAAGAKLTLEGFINDDVACLRAAATTAAPLPLVNPYCFEPAVAPHLAAQAVSVRIGLETIAAAFAELSARAEVVIVEGVGGFCVPLNDEQDGGDLASRLHLPVILVVGLRLGCLNHALLTAQAIRARRLRLTGWIANRIDRSMAFADQNVAALAQRLHAPMVADIAYACPPDPRVIAGRLELAALDNSLKKA